MWIRINQPFAVPLEVRSVLTGLFDAGFEAYLVGGCVRDWVRGDAIKDYDVATSAKPEDIERLFPKVVEVGRAFGVMKVIAENGRQIEVATFRKESDYQDYRHPSKVEFSSVMEDASRRDFTMNALYYDLKTGQVLDFFDGLNDVKNKVVRAIGVAEERFQEDALRLLRAVRFASRFTCTIEPETEAAIQKLAHLIQKVSVERVRDEVERILSGPRPREALILMHHLKLFEPVFPEIAVAIREKKKIWDYTLATLAHLKVDSEIETPAFYLALIHLPTLRKYPIDQRGVQASQISVRLKLSKEQQDLFSYLVQETAKFREVFSMRDATLFRWMKHEWFPVLMRFHSLDAMSLDGNHAGLEFVKQAYPEAKKRFDMKPLITGDDLVRLGMQPGRQFTEILNAIEDLTIEGQLKTKDEALEYVLHHFVT
jgi:poly(A) polymerase